MDTMITITIENDENGTVRVIAYHHGTNESKSLERTFGVDDAEDTVNWIQYALAQVYLRLDVL